MESNAFVRRVPFRAAFPGMGPDSAGDLFEVDGRLQAVVAHGPTRRPVVVNSIPKSGTYLWGLLLEQLGLVSSGLHFTNEAIWDFRDRPIEAIVAEPEGFVGLLPIEASLGLVRGGQFAAAHLRHDAGCRQATRSFVHLFCIRDLRDSLISFMRYLVDPRRTQKIPSRDWYSPHRDPRAVFADFLRENAATYVALVAAMLPWMTEPDVTVLRFETIMGDHGREAQRMALIAVAEAVGAELPNDPLALFGERVLNRKTRTFSGARSERPQYWDGASEAIFAGLGGPELNGRLGYDG